MRGYSLVEVLVALAVFSAAAAGLAPLVALSARANLQAKHITIAAVLAQQKIEELLPAAADELVPSPADALARTVDGYADFLDGAGRVLGGGATPPPSSAYVRRWSVDALTNGGADNSWVLQVVVTDLRSRGVARIVAARSGRAF
jgi:prepilin-type N-terminal cleavage/methylation domain-containing protein